MADGQTEPLSYMMVGRRRLEALLARCWSRAVLCMGSAEASEQQGRRMRVVLGQRCLSSATASVVPLPLSCFRLPFPAGTGKSVPKKPGNELGQGSSKEKKGMAISSA